MAVRHAALAVLSVLVLGAGLYLFFEVRASPAAAPPPAGKPTARHDEPEDDEPKPSNGEGRTAGIRNKARKVETVGARSSDPARTTPSAVATPASSDDGEKLEGVKLDMVMAEANRAYDKQEFDDARSIAQRVLKQYPDNVRMLRIMTSSYCIETDAGEAQKYFNLLPAPDREQMKTRCARYGVTFTEPPAK